MRFKIVRMLFEIILSYKTENFVSEKWLNREGGGAGGELVGE